MSNEQMKRRDALNRLAKMLALTSGLGAVGAGKLFPRGAQTVRSLEPRQLDKLITVKAVNLNAKILKGLLFNNRDVFLSEFGRVPGGLTEDAMGGMGCEFFFAVGASSCGEQNCGGMVGCNDNKCTDQTCGRFTNCGTNNCGNQHRASGFNAANCGVHSDIFSSQFLNEALSDPFIQALMKDLKITTSRQLSQQLQSMLLTKRSTDLRRTSPAIKK